METGCSFDRLNRTMLRFIQTFYLRLLQRTCVYAFSRGCAKSALNCLISLSITIPNTLWPSLPLLNRVADCSELYAHDDPDGAGAEFAVLVRSHLKGHGLGWLMMKHLIAYAQAKNLQTVHGQVLAENATMLKMCSELRFKIDNDPNERGMKVVTLQLEKLEH